MNRRSRQRRGFTLIEVMVALSITAIAVLAGIRATSALTGNATRQTDLLLAQLCAENALTALRLAAQYPGIGESSSPCEQGGRVFQVALVVRGTPNPSFRRVDAQVLDGAAAPLLQLSTVIGRY